MQRRIVLLPLGLLLGTLAGLSLSQVPKVDLVAKSEARSPEEEKKAFHLPPGFEAQLVASEPDIQKPLNIAFDVRGRLWVTDTIEYPYAAEKGRKPRDSVKVLSDFGPDGKARKIVTFADELNIPIGVLPLGNEGIVHSIPSVWKLTDTDGDGKSDKREVLYDRYGYDDTHGMTSAFTLSFDGWVYACHGFRNDSTIKGKDGSTIKLNSGNVYRFRTDGSRVEQVTWGQVNPFGLSLDPFGNLYSADCHSMPVYQLLRGAHYPSFGKPHEGLGYGPTMLSHSHNSTGIGGVVYYAANQFPEAYHGNIFLGNVVTSRINLDTLEWRGSSPWAKEQPDFLKSDDPWFRPVDLKLGPDGALYVADFYNRIIGHYEVDLKHPGRDRNRGRIWRIVYKGDDAKNPAAPRTDWSKARAAELIDDLGHPNLTVRMIAMNQLATRPGEAKAVVAALQTSQNAEQRAHALWVLERLNALDGATLKKMTEDPSELVRAHAVRVYSERKSLSQEERDGVINRLNDRDAKVRRAAADALSQHPDGKNVGPLLNLLQKTSKDDTHLIHVVRMALRNVLRVTSAWPLRLEKATVKEKAALVDIALAVPGKNSTQFVLDYVVEQQGVGVDLPKLAQFLAKEGGEAMVEKLVTELRKGKPDDIGKQAALFRAIEQGTTQRGGRLPNATREWGLALVPRLLSSSQSGEVLSGIQIAGSLHVKDKAETIASLLAKTTTTEDQRLAALDALAFIDGDHYLTSLGAALRANDQSFRVRQHAANTLSRLNTEGARKQLTEALKIAPASIQTAIAEALTGSAAGAEALLLEIEQGRASPRLLQERGVEGRLRTAKPRDHTARVTRLTMGLPTFDKNVQMLMLKQREGFERSKPELSAGLKVFEKNCASCHQIAGKGAKIGPQLDGIGIRGLDRLLEDTLDPNRNVDQAFRMTQLTLKKGQVISGLLLRQEGMAYIMADQQGKEVRVAESDVEEKVLSPLSPMPANVLDQLKEGEFYNLLAYLLSQSSMRK